MAPNPSWVSLGEIKTFRRWGQMTRLVDQRLGATLVRASRVSANETKKETAATDLVSVCNWIPWTIRLDDHDHDYDWPEANREF
ncbi:hypothetical protein KQX54_018703 [Cotesia glomerata]|uniref:Uncharacterized protein n=1 Tax=Cotesia glomerata TaxID=32391 RepID=A0AAV7I7T0_COTGL|nr:hypothetical protein KQX54_018703 [Cotesia glomerata]